MSSNSLSFDLIANSIIIDSRVNSKGSIETGKAIRALRLVTPSRHRCDSTPNLRILPATRAAIIRRKKNKENGKVYPMKNRIVIHKKGIALRSGHPPRLSGNRNSIAGE
jgi:hypothetical protein